MIVVVDYELGNLASIVNALKKLEIPSRISGDPNMIKKAKALILPGVGAAGEGMKNLKNTGLDKVITKEIQNSKPILGICLGMQLLFERSEEGDVECLGILKGVVKKFCIERKIPQIGWNEVKVKSQKPAPSEVEGLKVKSLVKNIPDESYFYFINSYYCEPEDKSIVVGISKYGEEFASIVVKDNIVTTQFHPEKSGKVGLQFLKNWSSLC